jgi:hypothetical protein
MALRRVFVIWTNPLFHESARLLLKHPDIDWVGADTDFTTAHGTIMKLQPDTILFEKTQSVLPAEMIEILEVKTWDVRIIGLSLDSNEVSLYHHEHQTVAKTGDLLQFVLG